jgi:hypothetical protein
MEEKKIKTVDANEVYETALKNRAKRFNITTDEAASVEGDDPLWVAAKDRAEKRGATPEDVLSEYDARLLSPTYPTLDCLTADEVLDYTTNDLSEDRLSHLSSCAPCTALVAATRPSENAVRTFLQHVRARRSGSTSRPREGGSVGSADMNLLAGLFEKSFRTESRQKWAAMIVFGLASSFVGAFAAVMIFPLVLPRSSINSPAGNFVSFPHPEIEKLSSQLIELQNSMDETRQLAVSKEVLRYLASSPTTLKMGETIHVRESATGVSGQRGPSQENIVQYKVTDPDKLKAAVQTWKTASTDELGLQPVLTVSKPAETKTSRAASGILGK